MKEFLRNEGKRRKPRVDLKLVVYKGESELFTINDMKRILEGIGELVDIEITVTEIEGEERQGQQEPTERRQRYLGAREKHTMREVGLWIEHQKELIAHVEERIEIYKAMLANAQDELSTYRKNGRANFAEYNEWREDMGLSPEPLPPEFREAGLLKGYKVDKI